MGIKSSLRSRQAEARCGLEISSLQTIKGCHFSPIVFGKRVIEMKILFDLEEGLYLKTACLLIIKQQMI